MVLLYQRVIRVLIMYLGLDLRQELGGAYKGREVPVAQSAVAGDGRIHRS